MLRRVANFFRFVRDRRYYVSLASENAVLKAQLFAVGADLEHARQRAQASVSEQATNYTERRSLVLVPRLVELLDDSDKFLIVDASAREVDRDLRWRPFPPECISFIGFEPDKGEAARLNAELTAAGLSRRFVAAGLWSTSGVLDFEHNNIGGGSSFLRQNWKVTDRWKFENPGEAKEARDIFFPVGNELMDVVTSPIGPLARRLEKLIF